jgi:hypothetical protein
MTFTSSTTPMSKLEFARGGRAIVVEEGVTARTINLAKEIAFFEDQNRICLGRFKSIGEFVKGFEVEKCLLSCGGGQYFGAMRSCAR